MTEAALDLDARVADAAAAEAPDSAGTGIGRKLRARRESLGMSIEDVAAMLKITPGKVEAIEAERWADLPTEPYLRGFLRNYARALQLGEDELPAQPVAGVRPAPAILRLSPSFETPLPRRSSGFSWFKGPTIAYLLLAALLLCGAVVWTRTQAFRDLRAQVDIVLRSEKPVAAVPPQPSGTTSPAAASDSAASASSASPAGTAADASNRVAEAEARNGAAGSMQARPDSNPTASSAAPPAVKPGDAAIVLKFGVESWAKVAQSDGQVLTSRLNAADTERNLSGTPPFELIIGNATGVKLQYRGADVDLAPYIRGNVARLTLK